MPVGKDQGGDEGNRRVRGGTSFRKNAVAAWEVRPGPQKGSLPSKMSSDGGPTSPHTFLHVSPGVHANCSIHSDGPAAALSLRSQLSCPLPRERGFVHARSPPPQTLAYHPVLVPIHPSLNCPSPQSEHGTQDRQDLASCASCCCFRG